MTTPPNVLPMIPPANFGNSTAPGKDDRGRFTSGPGNIGRVRGSKNKQSADLMRNVRSMGDRAVAQLSVALDNSERWAVELILKYCLPPSRTIEMDNLTPAEIRDAFINAELSADELKAVATAVEKLRSVESIDQLRERLTELETMLAAK